MNAGPTETITVEIVKERAALAGISLDEDRIADIAAMMEMALAPLRALDLREIRLVEPAVTFEAAWSEVTGYRGQGTG